MPHQLASRRPEICPEEGPMLLEVFPLKHSRRVHEWQAVSIQEQNLEHTAFNNPSDYLNVKRSLSAHVGW